LAAGFRLVAIFGIDPPVYTEVDFAIDLISPSATGASGA
jgi:hypothetical protein